MQGRAHKRPVQSGFFISYLKGDYRLARSYWLHSVFFAWVLLYLAGLAVAQIAAVGVRYVSMAVLAFEPLALMVWVWSTVGTFMSAIKQVFAGEGGRFWALGGRHGRATGRESFTLAFLAGHERTAADQARVGFHQARAIGEDRQRATRQHPAGRSRPEEEALYMQAGVSAAFARKVVNVPFAQMWVPTRQELLDAQVLAR
ncbi:hypothetical protein [Aquabacterium sp.]|uniref:hypothetical protein n=1 Tax=Aquabacterium sp. TaxID=1872578 RepID=UPI0019A60EDD|nr:hypothetical protein [Aquabacterium sp.]MBC7699560.1 hypothetical protein [Aquabacterium sp.]